MLGPLWEGVQKKLLDSGQFSFFLVYLVGARGFSCVHDGLLARF